MDELFYQFSKRGNQLVSWALMGERLAAKFLALVAHYHTVAVCRFQRRCLLQRRTGFWKKLPRSSGQAAPVVLLAQRSKLVKRSRITRSVVEQEAFQPAALPARAVLDAGRASAGETARFARGASLSLSAGEVAAALLPGSCFSALPVS